MHILWVTGNRIDIGTYFIGRIELVSSYQDEKTGLFTDPEIFGRKLTANHNLNYVTWQLTTFCISALHALDTEIKYPLRFLENWKNKDTIINWLEQQNWNNPWNIGNLVMSLGIMLITDYELTGDYNSKNA